MAYSSRGQKQFANQGVTFGIDISELIQALAAIDALAQSAKNIAYMDAVVDDAFKKADDAFNLETEAYAKATGTMSHMYEWGTIGINDKRSNTRQPASAPNSRLWNNYTEGTGLDRTLWFAYRPSVAKVPKPTKAETGMSPEIINKMKDHVFRWKAQVIDENITVTIETKKAKFLLIPAYDYAKPYMRPHDIKRGYMLHQGPLRVNPGRRLHQKGGMTFSEYWFKWWNTKGGDIVDAAVQSNILGDFRPEVQKRRTSKTVRPIGTFNIKTEIGKKSKRIQADKLRKARTRSAT